MAMITVAGNILLFALVFGMSATVEIESVYAQMRNYKALAIGMVCQFLILPLLGFIVVRSFKLDHAVGLTLLVVTSSPGGSYSNWFASMFNADLALSVSMTAVSTFLSVIMLPLNLIFYSSFITYSYDETYDDDVVTKLDWNALIVALVLVLTAISAGLFVSSRKLSPDFSQAMSHLGNSSGTCLILLSFFMTSTGDSDTKLWSRHWTFYIAVFLPCFGGLILSNIVASALELKLPERVTVAIECCYQNVGIATSVALTMFNGRELNDALGVPFMYGIAEGLLVAIYCTGAWKAGWTKAPADTPFFQFFWTSFEVLSEQEKDLDEIEVSADPGGDNGTPTRPNKRESVSGSTLSAYFRMEYEEEENADSTQLRD